MSRGSQGRLHWRKTGCADQRRARKMEERIYTWSQVMSEATAGECSLAHDFWPRTDRTSCFQLMRLLANIRTTQTRELAYWPPYRDLHKLIPPLTTEGLNSRSSIGRHRCQITGVPS